VGSIATLRLLAALLMLLAAVALARGGHESKTLLAAMLLVGAAGPIGIRVRREINAPPCLSFRPSAALRKGLHTPVCAPFRAWRTNKNPAQYLTRLFRVEP
jgi:hypothetical protein